MLAARGLTSTDIDTIAGFTPGATNNPFKPARRAISAINAISAISAISAINAINAIN